MAFLTKKQLEIIARQLAALSVKDSDLENAQEIKPDDIVAIVQDGINKKLSVDFFRDELQNGPRGLSAYEVAVKNGYEGTEEEWLNDPVNGIKGKGISSAAQTTFSDESEGNNVFTVNMTDGTSSTIIVKNGARGHSGVVLDGVTEETFVADVIYNGLGADDPEEDATKALSAYQGSVLDKKILYAPDLYLGSFSYKGVYNDADSASLTTKVFKSLPGQYVRIHIAPGYQATLSAGDNPDFTQEYATEEGWVVYDGSPYVYVGGAAYLCLNISHLDNSEITLAEAQSIDLRIMPADAKWWVDHNDRALANINASEGCSWDRIPRFNYGNAELGFGNMKWYHKVLPVRGGDVITITRSDTNTTTVQLVKSYSVPDNINNTYDFATGEQSRVIVNSTFTAPDDAKYLIVRYYDNPPAVFTINGFDVLTGSRYVLNKNPEGNVMVLQGFGGKDHVSKFTLRKGIKYRISFYSDSFRTQGGNYLVVRFGNSDLVGVDDEGNEYELDFSNPESGLQDVPVDCLYTPQADNVLYVITRFNYGTQLRITVTEERQDLHDLIKRNSRTYENIKDLRSWLVENQLTGGKFIGDEDATVTYMMSHVFTEKGECYVGTFISRTMTSEADPTDYEGGLIYFNLANPEKTTRFYTAIRRGDILFEGESVVADNPNYVINAQIDENTIRVMMLVGGYAVYKDFDIPTKTYETYCHRCYFLIDGEPQELKRANDVDFQEALGLTAYSDQHLLSWSVNPIKIDDYWYEAINFYGFSHALCRTQDFETWEMVSEIPYPYLGDEFQCCYLYNRIYVTATGNITRRPNGGFSAIMFYTPSNRSWSAIKYFDYYGHDTCAMVAVDGLLYVMHQRIHQRRVSEPNEYYIRADNYPDSFHLARSRKTIFVLDKAMNIIDSVDLVLRRGATTCHFGVLGGNLYAFVGASPKYVAGASDRQNGMFSFIDVRYISAL